MSVVRQTSLPIDLVRMCPAMDLCAVSLVSSPDDCGIVQVFRTRGDASPAAPAAASDADEQHNDDVQPTADAAAAPVTAATAAASSIEGSAPIFTHTIKSGKIVALQWAPAGGRLLAAATQSEVYVLHVELQALLRVHTVAGGAPVQSATATATAPSGSKDSTLSQSSPIVAVGWLRAPAPGTNPFPCSRILGAGSNHELLELAEGEWAGSGNGSLLLVAHENGHISALLGGITECALLSGAASLKGCCGDVFVSNTDDSLQITVQTGAEVSCCYGSRPLCVTTQARVLCQCRELLCKVRADLADLQKSWTDGVDKVIQKALPPVVWNNRAAIAASILSGTPLKRLLERRELDQSGVVAAAELLRDASVTVNRTVVDVLFECVAVLQDCANTVRGMTSMDQAAAGAAGALGGSSTSQTKLRELPTLLASIRAEMSEWVRHAAAERDMLAAVLRWLHHYIGSVRAAAMSENNEDGSTPPPPAPAASVIDPGDFLIAFDVLASPTTPVPESMRAALTKRFDAVQALAQQALDRVVVGTRAPIDSFWMPADNQHPFVAASSGGSAIHFKRTDAAAVTIDGKSLVLPSDDDATIDDIAVDSTPSAIEVFTTTSGTPVTLKRTQIDAASGTVLDSFSFTTQFAISQQQQQQQQQSTPILRMFPNSQRETIALVRGKKIEFLDVTPPDPDDEDEDADADEE